MKGLIDSFLDMFNSYVPEPAGTYLTSAEKMACKGKSCCQGKGKSKGKGKGKGKK